MTQRSTHSFMLRHHAISLVVMGAVISVCFFVIFNAVRAPSLIAKHIHALNALQHIATTSKPIVDAIQQIENKERIPLLQVKLQPLYQEMKFHIARVWGDDVAFYEAVDNTENLSSDDINTSLTSLSMQDNQQQLLHIGRALHALSFGSQAHVEKIVFPSRAFDIIDQSLRALEQEKLERFNINRTETQTNLLLCAGGILVVLIASWFWFVAGLNTLRANDGESLSSLNQGLYKEKRQFLNLMSHEFRAPISAIISALELIPNLKEQQGKLIQQAEQSCYRLLNLTNNLVDIFDEENDAVPVNEEIDLIRLLDEIVSPYSVRVRDKKVDFTMHCSHSVPSFILGNATVITKSIANVLDNAVKFTSNGLIDVSITTEVKEKKIYLVVRVNDSGTGISEDIQTKVFNRFFRAEQIENHRYPGAGVGLTIAKQNVESLEGTISFVSQEGIGTEFTIHIPITPVESLPHLSNVNRFVKFAIVDDLEISRLHLQNIITREGFTAQCFANGNELLNLHEDLLNFTAIFIDLCMPGINGLELTRTLHAIYGERTPPVILISATPDVANIVANQQLTIAQAFVKPIDTNRFVDTLHHFNSSQDKNIATTQKNVILVVEDEPINAEMTQSMLGCMGYEAYVVTNGEDAIVAITTRDFAAVLMDINLPDMSGIDVAKIIFEKQPSLPVIAITANARDEEKRASIKVGMRYHLVKPVTFQELKNTLALTLIKYD